MKILIFDSCLNLITFTLALIQSLHSKDTFSLIISILSTIMIVISLVFIFWLIITNNSEKKGN